MDSSQKKFMITHEEVQRQIAAMPEDYRNLILAEQEEVQNYIDKINESDFNADAFDLSRKSLEARKAGYGKPVGTIFPYKDKDGFEFILIKNPSGDIVPAQVYLNDLQKLIIGTTKEITRLQEASLETFTNKWLTQMSFLGLIKLAFKNLFRGK